MEFKTEGNITIVTLTYEEWEKKPFPLIHPYSYMIDHTMRYVIKGVPPDFKELFDGNGIVTCLN